MIRQSGAEIAATYIIQPAETERAVEVPGAA